MGHYLTLALYIRSWRNARPTRAGETTKGANKKTEHENTKKHKPPKPLLTTRPNEKGPLNAHLHLNMGEEQAQIMYVIVRV